MMTRRKLHSLISRLRRKLTRSFASSNEVERAEWSFYLSYLRPGMIVIDGGTWVGELALFFSRLVGEEGRVHAFEANRATFERLQTICRAVGRSNIMLNHVALADSAKEVELYVYGTAPSWSSLANRPLQNYGIQIEPPRKECVPATTIDSYCEGQEITRVDLLKLDLEGAEYQALLGARRMLHEKRVRCCVFEFGQTTFDMGNRPKDIESYLCGLGYRLRNIVRRDPVFPGGTRAETACFSMHVAFPEQ